MGEKVVSSLPNIQKKYEYFHYAKASAVITITAVMITVLIAGCLAFKNIGPMKNLSKGNINVVIAAGASSVYFVCLAVIISLFSDSNPQEETSLEKYRVREEMTITQMRVRKYALYPMALMALVAITIVLSGVLAKKNIHPFTSFTDLESDWLIRVGAGTLVLSLVLSIYIHRLRSPTQQEKLDLAAQKRIRQEVAAAAAREVEKVVEIQNNLQTIIAKQDNPQALGQFLQQDDVKKRGIYNVTLIKSAFAKAKADGIDMKQFFNDLGEKTLQFFVLELVKTQDPQAYEFITAMVDVQCNTGFFAALRQVKSLKKDSDEEYSKHHHELLNILLHATSDDDLLTLHEKEILKLLQKLNHQTVQQLDRIVNLYFNEVVSNRKQYSQNFMFQLAVANAICLLDNDSYSSLLPSIHMLSQDLQDALVAGYILGAFWKEEDNEVLNEIKNKGLITQEVVDFLFLHYLIIQPKFHADKFLQEDEKSNEWRKEFHDKLRNDLSYLVLIQDSPYPTVSKNKFFTSRSMGPINIISWYKQSVQNSYFDGINLINEMGSLIEKIPTDQRKERLELMKVFQIRMENMINIMGGRYLRVQLNKMNNKYAHLFL